MYPTGAPSPGFHDGYIFDFKWIDLAKPPQKSEMGRFLQSEQRRHYVKTTRFIHVEQYSALLHGTIFNP
jgi:hypothetical protein